MVSAVVGSRPWIQLPNGKWRHATDDEIAEANDRGLPMRMIKPKYPLSDSHPFDPKYGTRRRYG